MRDRNPVVASVEYVGHLEEILELTYGHLNPIVFLGRWVKANNRGVSVTMKRDEWGFTITNLDR